MQLSLYLIFGQSKRTEKMPDSQVTSLNHQKWLKTVPRRLLPFVCSAIKRWNARADQFNRWAELGWDERDALLRKEARQNA
jgi:hypothetical protein